MSRIADTQRIVDGYRSAELITGALQDISAVKMQELRRQFVQNARFFSGISDLYGVVKARAAALHVTDQTIHRRVQGRDIYIGLTSNKRFYGTLNRDVVLALVGMVRVVEKSDFLLIGSAGAQYLQEMTASELVEYMEFGEETPNTEELQEMFSIIDRHSRVFIVYPKFVNPFRQDVVMTDITQTPTSIVPPEMHVDYVFEPEISRMLEFFERQVRRVVFERVMLEAELARTAARTMKMHSAKERAQQLTHEYESKLRHEFEAFADIERMGASISFSSAKP